MKQAIIWLVLSFLLLNSQLLPAQKQFEVRIHISPSLDTSKIYLYYNKGKETITVHPVFVNNQFVLRDTFNSQYASVQLSYPRADGQLPYYNVGFFVSEAKAEIVIHAQNKDKNPLAKISTNNAYSFNEWGGDKLNAFTSQEDSVFWDFYNKNVDKFSENDSLVSLMFEKNQNILDKKTEFVRQNVDSYYSFWLFRTEVAYHKNLTADSLLSIFNLFRGTLRHSKEGKVVEQIIRGRSLQKKKNAPHFTAVDTKGQSVAIEDFRGKYILLNFWASWCAPCIQEMPQIQQIRVKYPKEQLEVLFFTLDEDTSAFERSVKKNDIGWGRHFFASNDHIRIFGAQAIPQVYLINPVGEILYNRDEEKDYDLKFLLEFLNWELQ